MALIVVLVGVGEEEEVRDPGMVRCLVGHHRQYGSPEAAFNSSVPREQLLRNDGHSLVMTDAHQQKEISTNQIDGAAVNMVK